MMPSTNIIPSNHHSGWNRGRLIFAGGLIAGTLDLSAALINYYLSTGKDPTAVLRFIASGALGSYAFEGSKVAIAAAGTAFHYFIAFSFTILFYILCRRFPVILRKPLLAGSVYGILIWLIMQFIVLPLSLTPHLPLDADRVIKGILFLVTCIGIPLAFLFRKYIHIAGKSEPHGN